MNKEPQHRSFMILKKPHLDFITADDFKPYFKVLLDEHPGLLFLKETPDFQERYGKKNINRTYFIFYTKISKKLILL
jgi:serine/threonine-protein phosphatase 2A regulatory subunit B''